MKRLQIPKNKFLKLIINVVLIAVWFNIYWYIDFRIFMGNYHYESFLRIFSIGNFLVMPFYVRMNSGKYMINVTNKNLSYAEKILLQGIINEYIPENSSLIDFLPEKYK